MCDMILIVIILFNLQEPYHSLSLLVNTSTSEYIFRVLGTTRERGFYSDVEDIKDIITNKFSNTVACVGNPRLKIEEGAVQIEQPFSMTVAANCLSYYVVSPEEEIAQGRGRCSECTNEVKSFLSSSIKHQNIMISNVQVISTASLKFPSSWSEEVGRQSTSSNTDEDMKVRTNNIALCQGLINFSFIRS